MDEIEAERTVQATACHILAVHVALLILFIWKTDQFCSVLSKEWIYVLSFYSVDFHDVLCNIQTLLSKLANVTLSILGF